MSVYWLMALDDGQSDLSCSMRAKLTKMLDKFVRICVGQHLASTSVRLIPGAMTIEFSFNGLVCADVVNDSISSSSVHFF